MLFRSQDSNGRIFIAIFSRHRIAFARDGLYEGRFAAAVWAENSDVFSGAEAKAEIVEGDFGAAHHADVAEIEKRWRWLGRWLSHAVPSVDEPLLGEARTFGGPSPAGELVVC